jgi:hypothetical protein
MSTEPIPFGGWVQYSDDTVMPKRNDPVNHPKHYTSHPSGVECIEITRHMKYNLGNAIKYIWRADLKGKDIEDLEKAVFYLLDEIELRRKKNV